MSNSSWIPTTPTGQWQVVISKGGGGASDPYLDKARSMLPKAEDVGVGSHHVCFVDHKQYEFIVNTDMRWVLVGQGGDLKHPELTVKTGHACKRCREYNEYAAANQSDGSFVCFGCRSGL